MSYGPFDVPQSNELEGSTTLTIVGVAAVIKIARGRGADGREHRHDPEARFSLMVSEAGKEFGVDSYISVDPGSLGGLAKCGNGTINGVPAAVCAWSGNGTTGLLVNSLQEAGALGSQVASLRTEVEKTSMS
jgi:hypothetical protein